LPNFWQLAGWGRDAAGVTQDFNLLSQ
jgi:hypothetical protein